MNKHLDFIVKNSWPAHIVVVGGFVRNNEGKLLLVKSPKRGWELPGGQVENGESLKEGLIREIQEETGLNVLIQKITIITSNITAPSKVLIDFECLYESGKLKTSDESIDVGWFEIQEATKLIQHPTCAARLEAYKSNKQTFLVIKKNPFEILSKSNL